MAPGEPGSPSHPLGARDASLQGTFNQPPLGTDIPCSLEQVLQEPCLCPLFLRNSIEPLPHLGFAAAVAGTQINRNECGVPLFLLHWPYSRVDGFLLGPGSSGAHREL